MVDTIFHNWDHIALVQGGALAVVVGVLVVDEASLEVAVVVVEVGVVLQLLVVVDHNHIEAGIVPCKGFAYILRHIQESPELVASSALVGFAFDRYNMLMSTHRRNTSVNRIVHMRKDRALLQSVVSSLLRHVSSDISRWLASYQDDNLVRLVCNKRICKKVSNTFDTLHDNSMLFFVSVDHNVLLSSLFDLSAFFHGRLQTRYKTTQTTYHQTFFSWSFN